MWYDAQPSMKYHSGPRTQPYGPLQSSDSVSTVSCPRIISDASPGKQCACGSHVNGALPRVKPLKSKQGRPANATLLALCQGAGERLQDVAVSPRIYPAPSFDQVHRQLQRINRADQEQGVGLLAYSQKDCLRALHTETSGRLGKSALQRRSWSG